MRCFAWKPSVASSRRLCFSTVVVVHTWVIKTLICWILLSKTLHMAMRTGLQSGASVSAAGIGVNESVEHSKVRIGSLLGVKFLPRKECDSCDSWLTCEHSDSKDVALGV